MLLFHARVLVLVVAVMANGISHGLAKWMTNIAIKINEAYICRRKLTHLREKVKLEQIENRDVFLENQKCSE